MTDARDRPRLERPESGQQKGSKRREASLCNRVGIGHLSPRARMIRAIARQSSPIVASVEQACHAGGRGFESRLRPNGALGTEGTARSTTRTSWTPV